MVGGFHPHLFLCSAACFYENLKSLHPIEGLSEFCHGDISTIDKWGIPGLVTFILHLTEEERHIIVYGSLVYNNNTTYLLYSALQKEHFTKGAHYH